jgi:hypothetical protein
MREIPILVMRGGSVLYRDFSCGNVVIPVEKTERAAVAHALRKALEMVNGDVSLPFFSTVSDCSAGYSQTEPSLCDHKAYAAALQTGWSDNQSDLTSTPLRCQHPNDNL